jgi:anti-sigma factor RsiW
MHENCPRTVELSACLDHQLEARDRERIEAHVASCAVCAAELADLRVLRADLKALPDETLGFDLGSVIEGRLAQRPRPAPRRRPGRPVFGWLPLGVGMAASVSLGITLGAMLTTGTGAGLAPGVAAMAVFDPVAPGGLCIGLEACYARGAVK